MLLFYFTRVAFVFWEVFPDGPGNECASRVGGLIEYAHRYHEGAFWTWWPPGWECRLSIEPEVPVRIP